MNLADRLKIARESIGKGQKDMAQLCHASYRTWQGYEAGETQPNAKAFEALAKLGFNTNWLLTGEGEMKRGEVIYPLTEELKNSDFAGEKNKGQAISRLKPDLTWFHDWINEELQGKSMSEIMAIAVKMKNVIDSHKGE